jgi:hypothetical protein
LEKLEILLGGIDFRSQALCQFGRSYADVWLFCRRQYA